MAVLNSALKELIIIDCRVPSDPKAPFIADFTLFIDSETTEKPVGIILIQEPEAYPFRSD